MTRLLLAAVAAAALAAPFAPADDAKTAKKVQKNGPVIGHMVYFKLKDASPAARQKLVEACKKYLSDHDGVVFFSAGVIADDFKREVNDREWDVALHLVFENKAAHDKYQEHPDHLKFIEENKDNWAKVRVFDSELTDYKAGKKKEPK
ncbi:MAG TPA: Dabb family protein [Gemmataceae bacterium]|nr:Dabb family protein [Gemmataceae bacterium]